MGCRGGWGRAREVLCGDVRRVWMGAEGGGGENEARLPGGKGTDVRAIGGVAPTGRRAGAAPVGGTNASRHRRLLAPAARRACNVAGVPALNRGWAARGVAHVFFFGSSFLFPPLGVASAQRPPPHSGGVLYTASAAIAAPPSTRIARAMVAVGRGGGAVRRLRLPFPAAVGAPPPRCHRRCCHFRRCHHRGRRHCRRRRRRLRRRRLVVATAFLQVVFWLVFLGSTSTSTPR